MSSLFDQHLFDNQGDTGFEFFGQVTGSGKLCASSSGSFCISSGKQLWALSCKRCVSSSKQLLLRHVDFVFRQVKQLGNSSEKTMSFVSWLYRSE